MMDSVKYFCLQIYADCTLSQDHPVDQLNKSTFPQKPGENFPYINFQHKNVVIMSKVRWCAPTCVVASALVISQKVGSCLPG